MVQQALPRQDTILGLTTALTAIAGRVALPEPVAKAAQQVLAVRLNLDAGRPGGAEVRAAIQQSGVFQEALLAGGRGTAAAGDLKSALLALRQGLAGWLGNQAPVAQVSGVQPPLRGQLPRARAGEAITQDLPDDPMDLAKHLMERSEAALSRLRLHQNASLPDPNPLRQEAQWSMDLPVVIGGQQHILHMQIQRDAEKDGERSGDRGWQVRFAINLAERGEAGAQISLRGKNTGVLIWAEHAETANMLASAVEDLRTDLSAVGLVPGAIVVRTGPPAEQPSQPVGQAGHIVDARR
jgi:Flagellar hook-length control protein FliK.